MKSFASSNAVGHDLQTFTGAINNWNGTYYTLNGSFNAGHSYDISAAGGDLNTIHNGNCNTVTDLEVYLVKKKTQLKGKNYHKIIYIYYYSYNRAILQILITQ